MKRFAPVASFAVMTLLGGCMYADPLPSTAVLQPAALQTNGDVDVRAINLVAYGFGHYKELQGDPALSAETVAALDYLGGQLNTSPRWQIIPSLFRLQMLDGRNQVRGLLGISPDVPSQAVVDTMVGLEYAYRAGDQAAVDKLLAAPIFSLPPAETAQRLANLPYLPALNNAASHTAAFAFGIYVGG
ncbi:hypothetical protein ACELLULO517_08450 [Acidisoma cellulosilytica]|uniref:Uncharacterized protein n=1 Tax=Acidisoma cellulosilyticum TaxID=2802395 RepID=A0A964E3D7_9PROT|nr:hypothetical protein [Acidisoma cellulosilyticum]MCB8880259.1 hypothetical protein [Acidisoma cellulosilyticum]